MIAHIIGDNTGHVRELEKTIEQQNKQITELHRENQQLKDQNRVLQNALDLADSLTLKTPSVHHNRAVEPKPKSKSRRKK